MKGRQRVVLEAGSPRRVVRSRRHFEVAVDVNQVLEGQQTIWTDVAVPDDRAIWDDGDDQMRELEPTLIEPPILG